MAQYKVPQDVEAEDKLLGPFTFRQFIYLLITAGCLGLSYGLFHIFPVLAIIPLPFVVFFAVLALPLRRDQPMETYLAAVVSFYLKPRKRFWTPGERESSILITAPKITEEPRTRDITEEEAGHRLSFLANLVDSEGYAIKNMNNSAMREEYVAEANTATDILDTTNSGAIDQMIAEEQRARHAELISQMRTAIARTEEIKDLSANEATINTFRTPAPAPATAAPATMVEPAPTLPPTPPSNIVSPTPPAAPANTTPSTPPAPRPDMANLANNPDYSVQTIQKEANRLQAKKSNEVYISLH